MAVNLDDVDFSWQVARYFETNFGFANGWLGPDFHEFFPPKRVNNNLHHERTFTLGPE
jgi:hypothetical protein